MFIPATGVSLILWGIYMAIEPFVRRRLPETIITWNRILKGEFLGPLVGRDALIGIAAACGFIVSALSVRFITSTGDAYRMRSETLLGAKQILSLFISLVGQSFANPLLYLLIFFLLCFVLRKRWLAVVCLIVFIVAINSFGVSANGSSVALLGLRSLYGGLMVFLLLRFGLLAASVFSFSFFLFDRFPITPNFSAWYAGSGIFAIAVLLALACLAFYTSLGGRGETAG